MISHRIGTAILINYPEWAEFFGDPDKEDVLMYNNGGRQFVLETTLPRKKGTVDDIFVFQKIKPNPQASETSSK